MIDSGGNNDFLDDILGDPLTPASATATAVLDPPEPAPAPTPADPAPTPAPARATRSTRKSQCLFFDLETVPDLSRVDLYDLPPIPEPAQYLSEAEGYTPSELVAPKRADEKPATLDDIKAAIAAALAKASPKRINRKVLVAAMEIEQKAPKPRKGVLDIFKEMIAEIDNEARFIADAVTTRNKTMAVCPEMNRIIAFGWAIGEDPIQSMVVGMEAADGKGVLTESDLLTKFWSLLGNAGPVCGFNILGFDLPTIFVRSAFNDIKPRKKIDLKPWGNDAIDLMAVRFPKQGSKGLGWLAKVNEIESEMPDMDGSKVGELYAAGELVKVGQYVRDDVHLSRELWRKYLGFWW